ncbi:hypothetical protein SGPA1_31590 [Streptomyces misionensis JCM 4497]
MPPAREVRLTDTEQSVAPGCPGRCGQQASNPQLPTSAPGEGRGGRGRSRQARVLVRGAGLK